MSNLRQRGTKTQEKDSSQRVNGHKQSSSISSILHSHSHGHDSGEDDDHEEHTGEAMLLLEALRGNGQ